MKKTKISQVNIRYEFFEWQYQENISKIVIEYVHVLINHTQTQIAGIKYEKDKKRKKRNDTIHWIIKKISKKIYMSDLYNDNKRTHFVIDNITT